MQIIILGAGQVGSSVAESLVSENNDITLVDTSRQQLELMRERFELRTICGNGASPSILHEAGAKEADLLIAVTQSDQTNLCACRVARSLFNLPTRIARLHSGEFSQYPKLIAEEFAVDFSICPEQIVTDYISRLISFPGSLQVFDFANNTISLIAAQAIEGGPIVGHPIRLLAENLGDVETRIIALYRNGFSLQVNGDTLILPGDEVFMLAASAHIRQVLYQLRPVDRPMRRVLIGGGGNIGARLAMKIEDEYNVKVLENNPRRAEDIATILSKSLVLRGDTTDEKLLENEGIGETDIFVSLTNDDEDNIMSASLAKRMGARRTIALINRRVYAGLVQGGPIDIALSPALISIGSLLTHIRRGDVVAVHSLRRGAAEALEIIAHGSYQESRIVGRRIADIDLPKGVTIGALMREKKLEDDKVERQVIFAHHDTIIEQNDHVIIFCPHKRLVRQVEKLFQVGFGFF